MSNDQSLAFILAQILYAAANVRSNAISSRLMEADHTVLQMKKVRSLYMQHLPSSSKTVDIGDVQMQVREAETQIIINSVADSTRRTISSGM